MLRFPKRIEEGISKNTVAVMQPTSAKIKNGKENWNQEIWAMYQLRGSEAISKSKFPISKQIRSSKTIHIISAWRYPGVSPKNNPIPKEILEEINNLC